MVIYHIQVYSRQAKLWLTWETYNSKREAKMQLKKLHSESITFEFRLVRIKEEEVK